MSLMLRKDCQPILDSIGLHNYHVDIHSDKYLTVISECGKHLFTVFGIRFTKKTPSIAEREYATELFEAFVIKYASDIKTYIQEKKKLQSLTFPDIKEHFAKPHFVCDTIVYKDPPFVIRLNIKNYFKIEASSNALIPFPRVDGQIKLSLKLHDEMYRMLEQHLEYKAQEELVGDLQAKLSSCKI